MFAQTLAKCQKTTNQNQHFRIDFFNFFCWIGIFNILNFLMISLKTQNKYDIV